MSVSRLLPPITALVAFAALLLAPTRGHAQTVDDLRLTLDKDVYFSDFDTIATVTLEGAPECAGQTVRIGFAGAAQPVEVVVSMAGRASVPVPLHSGSPEPFVEGDCIPGGRFVADRLSPGGPYIDRVPPIPLEIRSDKTAYAPGDLAMLSLQGLGPCVGQSVWLGLFYNDGYRVRGQTVEVDNYGRAQLEMLMEGLEFTGARPGVRGDCIQPGYYLGPELVSFSGSTGPSTPRFSFDIPSPHRPLLIRISIEGFTECALRRPMLVGLYDSPEYPVEPGASSFAHAHVGLDGSGSGRLFVNSPNADGYGARLAISGDCVPGGMISSEELFVIPAIAPDPPPVIPDLSGGGAAIVAPVSLLDQQFDADDPRRWRDRVPQVDVWAGGQFCGTWALNGTTDPSGHAIFILGKSDQPTNCSRTGVGICLEMPPFNQFSRATPMNDTFTFAPGATFTLTNFAPRPPHSPGCRVPGPLDTGTGWEGDDRDSAVYLLIMLAGPLVLLAVRRTLKAAQSSNSKQASNQG